MAKANGLGDKSPESSQTIRDGDAEGTAGMKRFSRLAAGVFLVTSLAAVRCALAAAWDAARNSAAPGGLKSVVHETSLGKTAGRCIFWDAIISPDGRRVALWVLQGGRQRVCVDGVDGPLYDEVRCPVFSPDSKRVGYPAWRDGKWMAVVDGVEGPPYDHIDDTSFRFSPDSQAVAFRAARGRVKVRRPEDRESGVAASTLTPHRAHDIFEPREEREAPIVWPGGLCGFSGDLTYFLVVGGKEYPDTEKGTGAVLSPDFQHVAYADEDEKSGKQCVVRDGVRGRPYVHIPWLGFSPDSRRLAFIVADAKPPDDASDRPPAGNWRLVIDGLEGKPYDRIGAVYFSPDSRRVLYAARRGKKELVVVDGKEGKPYQAVTMGESIFAYRGRPSAIPWSVFSPDSAHVVFLTHFTGEGGREGPVHWGVVVRDSHESRRYDAALMARFSPDSQHLAWIACSRDEQCVVLDGVEGPRFDEIVELPVFSPDSRRLAYVGQRGADWFVVVDGREAGPYDSVDERIVFSPDSRRVAWAARCGHKSVVVVDGVPGKRYDRIYPRCLTFSLDSQHVVYVARWGRKALLVVDGTGYEAGCDTVLGRSQPVFSGPDTFTVLLGRRREIIRVEVQIDYRAERATKRGDDE